VSRSAKKRPPKGEQSLALAIADIQLVEALLGENQTRLKRLVAELSTVKARLATASRLLAADDRQS
jgi:hypothetical protein